MSLAKSTTLRTSPSVHRESKRMLRSAIKRRDYMLLFLVILWATSASVVAAEDYVLGPDDVLTVTVMRHPESLGLQPLRQSDLVKSAWSDFRLDLCTTSGKVLDSTESIVQATLEDHQLLAQTDYDDGDFHVCIQHPVKTINVNERDNIYQTDTGPIILPDLSPQRLAQAQRRIEVFDLAFSAFNCPEWAEFVICVPTAVSEQISVDHYSKFRRIDNTRNAIIQID